MHTINRFIEDNIKIYLTWTARKILGCRRQK